MNVRVSRKFRASIGEKSRYTHRPAPLNCARNYGQHMGTLGYTRGHTAECCVAHLIESAENQQFRKDTGKTQNPEFRRERTRSIPVPGTTLSANHSTPPGISIHDTRTVFDSVPTLKTNIFRTVSAVSVSTDHGDEMASHGDLIPEEERP